MAKLVLVLMGLLVSVVGASAQQKKWFLFFFDWSHAGINDSSKQYLSAAVEAYKQANNGRVRVIGHADASEADGRNLSTVRAQAVRRELIANGIPASAISVQSLGATRPLVKPDTSDGREPQNRRVEITVEPGAPARATRETPARSPVAAGPATGARVLGYFQGGPFWFPGIVRQSAGGRVVVDYDDGDVETLPAASVRAFNWRVGSRVSCNWLGRGSWYPGAISGMSGQTLEISYDDGDFERTSTASCRSR